MLHAILFLLALPSLSASPLSLSSTDLHINTDLADGSAQNDISEDSVAGCSDGSPLSDATSQNNQDLGLVPRATASCPTSREIAIPGTNKFVKIPWKAPETYSYPQAKPKETGYEDHDKCTVWKPIPVTCSGPEVWYGSILGFVVDCVYGMFSL